MKFKIWMRLTKHKICHHLHLHFVSEIINETFTNLVAAGNCFPYRATNLYEVSPRQGRLLPPSSARLYSLNTPISLTESFCRTFSCFSARLTRYSTLKMSVLGIKVEFFRNSLRTYSLVPGLFSQLLMNCL